MNIEEKVKEILSDLCDGETIMNVSTLQGDLALDSLLMVTLLIELEEKFGIELDESDMNPFDLITVQDVICLVGKYCGGDEHE